MFIYVYKYIRMYVYIYMCVLMYVLYMYIRTDIHFIVQCICTHTRTHEHTNTRTHAHTIRSIKAPLRHGWRWRGTTCEIHQRIRRQGAGQGEEISDLFASRATPIVMHACLYICMYNMQYMYACIYLQTPYI